MKYGKDRDMARRQITSIIVIILLLLPFPPLVHAQGRSGRRAKSRVPTSTPPQQTSNTASQQKQDSWWMAQRSIEAAIQQLEAYLRESPDGERAATARQQLEVLRSLTITASRPEWVLLGSMPLRDVPEWRG